MAVDRDKVLQAAQKLVERKRYDKAIVEYQKLVADDPKDVRTLLKIGDLFLKMEEYVDAITTYERVGEFYSNQGFALKAIAVYKQIREIILKHVPHLSDRFGHIVPRLAEIYAQLGLTSDALAAYDEVATRLQKAGRDRDAIDVFRKIVELEPNNPLVHLRLAEALVRIKDYDGAIQRFGTAAEILLKLGRRDDALKVVERLLQHRTDARSARMAAEIYLDRGDAADGMAALAKLQIAFKENPKDLQTLTLLARAFDLLAQPAKAIEVQKESARIAKEAGRLDQFTAIVTSLRARAPNDEGVLQLVAQLAPSIPSPASDVRASDARASIDIEVDIVDEEEEGRAPSELPPASAAPIPIPTRKQSHAAIEPYDSTATARQIIAQADAHLRTRQLEKALAVLRSGVSTLPASREIRQRLCDVLFDAGDHDGAINELLEIARLHADDDDIQGAVGKLDEVLLIEPGHPKAKAMLRELGYAVPQEADVEPADTEIEDGEPSTFELQVDEPETYPQSEPLPQYEIDDQPTDSALALRTRIDEIDDPFGGEAPLPHFPLEDEQTEFMPPPVPPSVSHAVAPPYARQSTPGPMPAVRQSTPGPMPAVPPSAREPIIAPPPQRAAYAPVALPQAPVAHVEPVHLAPPPSASRADAFDEDALEEAEFFAQQGMFEEAKNLIQEQLTLLPNHPLLLERLREVNALEAAQRGVTDKSGTHARPPESKTEEQFWDLATAIAAIDNIELDRDQAQAGAADDSGQVSAEEVFDQFKKGVAAQISDSDAATHYDLGVAYKEMGLLPDAIKEFELAARDPGRECVCQSMIGVIHLQMGNVDAAIDAFILGLRAPQRTVEQELALNYEIANAYEMRRDRDQALYYFQRVFRLNANYMDPRGSVADRVRRLEAPKPAARAAVGAELLGDDFDAAFDDLLSRAKLP